MAVTRCLSLLGTAVPFPVSPSSWAKGAWQAQGQAWGTLWLGTAAGHIHPEALPHPVSLALLPGDRHWSRGLVFLWARQGRAGVPACARVPADGEPLLAPLGSWVQSQEMSPAGIPHAQPRQHPSLGSQPLQVTPPGGTGQRGVGQSPP